MNRSGAFEEFTRGGSNIGEMEATTPMGRPVTQQGIARTVFSARGGSAMITGPALGGGRDS